MELVGHKSEFLQNVQATQLGGDDAWHRRTGERQGRGVSGKHYSKGAIVFEKYNASGRTEKYTIFTW